MSGDQLYAMRHSLAHITAQAVQHLWPEAKFGVGPVVENGFYYDIDLGDTKISETDFGRIEKEMRTIINKDFPFERSEKNIDEALEWARNANQPYKVELLNDLKREGTTKADELNRAVMGMALPAGIMGVTGAEVQSVVENVSFYTDGDFTDLCHGPHAESTGKVGAFKLMRVAGAYWRGDEKKAQMQRLYGVAFATKEELEQHLTMLEEAKKRDHRKLGKELDLYHVSDLVGAGLPLITPRGSVLREQLSSYSQELQAQHGFERVWTPHMAKVDLYHASGHYDKYPERFEVTSEESDDVFMMKPMNCPHHIQLFSRKPWSYRELPVRYMENTTNYRDEKSGELHGLARVRSLSQDDGHIFCKESDIENEVSAIVQMVVDLYSALGMEFYARLSYRDETDKYLGDAEVWKKAEAAIARVAHEKGLDSVDGQGEAAFYGPKIDFMVRDSLGREWQCATIQLDFVQPERFGLEYTDANGEKQRPVMIHKALLGSIERFMSVYIEHTAGRFPLWLAPEQLRIIQVNDDEKVVSFVQRLKDLASDNGIRMTVDDSNESVGKKIRAAATLKVPYSLVIGDKEVEQGQVTPRVRGDIAVEGREEKSYDVEQFVTSIAHEAKARASKSSL